MVFRRLGQAVRKRWRKSPSGPQADPSKIVAEKTVVSWPWIPETSRPKKSIEIDWHRVAQRPLPWEHSAEKVWGFGESNSAAFKSVCAQRGLVPKDWFGKLWSLATCDESKLPEKQRKSKTIGSLRRAVSTIHQDLYADPDYRELWLWVRFSANARINPAANTRAGKIHAKDLVKLEQMETEKMTAECQRLLPIFAAVLPKLVPLKPSG